MIKEPRKRGLDDFMRLCEHCHQPLIQIDRYGERWIGCLNCNKWGKPRDTNLVMELSDEDWRR